MSDYRDSNDPMYGYEPPDRTGIWGSAIVVTYFESFASTCLTFRTSPIGHCSDALLLESRTLPAVRLGVFPLTGGRS
jgi:hypothetical protein